MSKRGTYLGGGTIVTDTGFAKRVAHRIRMTERQRQKLKQAKKRLEAERRAYEAAPKSTLIKAKPKD